jgi:hypothetical protein
MQNSNTTGSSTLAGGLNALPNQKPVTLNAPRMLNASEIASLRQHKQAVAAFMREKLARGAAGVPAAA